MFDWDDFHTFLAIARHGSLSAAARALGVQQSTMGRRLAALEQRSGAALLQRTSSGFVLTEAGEAILANAERIEAEVTAAERRISGRDIRLEGTVRLTAVETLAVEVVMPMLAAFHARYPGITVELIADPRPLSLVKREADVALRYGRLEHAEVVARLVTRIGAALYASPAYLQARGMPEPGGRGHCVIVTERDLLAISDMQWMQRLLPEAATVLATNSRFAHRAACVAGMGLATLSRYLGDPAAGLVRLPLGAPPPRELWLAVHNDIRHMPRVRALTEFLAAGFRERGAGLEAGERPTQVKLDGREGRV
jgi:DNA-binding transcriptional LysR family regulator